MTEAPENARRLSPLRKVATRIERAIKGSVADETEVVFVEKVSSRTGLRADLVPQTQHTAGIETRVHVSGRRGFFRSGDWDRGEVSRCIRMALAAARSEPPSHPPEMPATTDADPIPELFDSELAHLTEAQGCRLMRDLLDPDEAAILEWHSGQVLVHNSHGLERRQRVTSVFLQVRSGEGQEAGFATGASRSLEGIMKLRIDERARSLRSRRTPGELPAQPCPVALAPEATLELLDVLSHFAFSSQAYREGGSFLREHLGVQVFDGKLDLVDDGACPHGLAFPFDLEGRTKSRVSLIERGVPRTPCVDTAAALEFGLEPTAHCVGGGQAHPLHLALAPGDADQETLLGASSGGLWISRLERIECYDPSRMLIRAVARGVRTVSDGAIAHPLPDLVWEDSLLRIFSDVVALGCDTSLKTSADGILGGSRAPAMVVPSVSGLRLRGGDAG